MVGDSARQPWTGAAWARMLAMAAWLIVCDLWIKATAQVAACPSVETVGAALSQPWSVPPACRATDFWGMAQLVPVVRDSAPWGIARGSLGAGSGQIAAFVLLGVGLLVTVALVRWRWRSPGDALALGTLWGAIAIEAGPRLRSGGAGMAELQLGGLSTGLGDIALLWVLLWLSWRLLAEARA